MINYTTKETNAENFMHISLLLKKIWYLKDSRNGHFAMHYSSFDRSMTRGKLLGNDAPLFIFISILIMTQLHPRDPKTDKKTDSRNGDSLKKQLYNRLIN